MRNFADRLSDRVVTVDADGTSHLAAILTKEIPGNVLWFMTDSTSHLAAILTKEIPGNVPWFMTDSTAVLEDGYSEVVVNVTGPSS